MSMHAFPIVKAQGYVHQFPSGLSVRVCVSVSANLELKEPFSVTNFYLYQ